MEVIGHANPIATRSGGPISLYGHSPVSQSSSRFWRTTGPFGRTSRHSLDPPRWFDAKDPSSHDSSMDDSLSSGGLAALAPKTRADHGSGRVSPDIIAQALALRAEDPHRSARHIITMLEWAGAMAPGSLCHSTLTYHFRKAGAAAYVGAMPAETFRRRQAPHKNAEWQGDYVRNRVMERDGTKPHHTAAGRSLSLHNVSPSPTVWECTNGLAPAGVAGPRSRIRLGSPSRGVGRTRELGAVASHRPGYRFE